MTHANNSESLPGAGSGDSRVATPGEVGPHNPWVLRLRLVWDARKLIACIWAAGVALSLVIALLLPKSYQSTARLMPPDSESSSNAAILSALASSGPVLSGAGSLLFGIKSSGALFIGILRSRTVEDRLVARFDLREVYGETLLGDASEKLRQRTFISEDRKSEILTLTVTDRDPRRATALAGAYIEELNRLVTELSTSSARRERVFLERRLETVHRELERAESNLSEFASRNAAIDIPVQGKAMVDAAAHLQDQIIAAQAELEGLM